MIETFQGVKRLFRGGHKRIHIHPGTGVTGRGMTQPRTHSVQGRSPVTCIDASIIGPPMTDIEFFNLTSEHLHANLEEQVALHDDLHVKIRAILFRTKNISGAMSLLEKLGIQTSH